MIRPVAHLAGSRRAGRRRARERGRGQAHVRILARPRRRRACGRRSRAFSAKVKGKGKFSVAGMSVTSVGKATRASRPARAGRGQRVRPGAAAARALPAAGSRALRGRQVRPSKLNMERRDRRCAPRLTCAVTRGRGRRRSRRRPEADLVEGRQRRRGERLLGVRATRCPEARRPSGRYLTAAARRARAARQRRDALGDLYPRQEGGVRGRGGQALPGSLTLDPRRGGSRAGVGTHQRLRRRRADRHDLRVLLRAGRARPPAAPASRAPR